MNFNSLKWGLILLKLSTNYLSRLDAEAIPRLNLENSCFEMGLFKSGKSKVQLLTFAYIRLLNKHYENEVTLRGQNIC